MRWRTCSLQVIIALWMCFSFVNKAEARPEFVEQQAKEKFSQMDSDANGLLSREEFLAALPNMRAEAFGTIDKNADGSISLDEWLVFLGSHGMGKGMEKGMDKGSGEERQGENPSNKVKKRENMLLMENK